MLLMNLMQYDNVISFAFPFQAIVSTILLFILLIVIISIQSYLNVRRVQLIELFHAKEKMERPISSSMFFALFSIFLLGMAFFLISRGRASVVWQDHSNISMIAVTIGIIGGTYLFFHQFSGWLLQTISRRKNSLEGNTVLWTSSLRFSVRSNTLNLTFISLFSAVIILLVGFVSINYAVQFEATGRNLPNDIAFESLDEQTNREIDDIIKESSHPIIYHEKIEGLSGKSISNMGIAFENPEYFTEDMILLPEQQYNELVTLRGHDQLVDLQGNEAVALSQGLTRTFTGEQTARIYRYYK
jgi:putative ABC transport system permease protein